ncbi:hypothetical protein EV189_2530 [Motilibacter rhizosphaerae]|uniref:ATP synthase protein I n=1 Tax=Motilibacter rhizosphaerae TaxID=598652 RepID=A0A4Q7NPW6_9ACTN|nr:hypothetical protein [Motilibacter rhizosphaerae]RZS87108.1 hypothetical protein EV189_2530 [Motilibacter rhizosphaerae]
MHSYDAAVLRAAALPAGAVAVVCSAVCLLVAGGPGLAGAVLATTVVLAVFTTTLWMCSRTRSTAPGLVTAAVLGGYLLKVLVLGALLAVAGSTSAVSGGAVAATLVAVTLAWMAGEVRAFTRLRTPYVEPVGWPVPAAARPAERTRA